MGKLRSSTAMVLCGISTFTFFPVTNYSSCYTHNASALMMKAWERTGQSLRSAMDKVVAREQTKEHSN